MTSPLPTGTLTFLFTDIEGSTARWEAQREAMADALVRHDVLLREAIEGSGGTVFKTVGDAFCAVFADAEAAEAWSAGTSNSGKMAFGRQTGMQAPQVPAI